MNETHIILYTNKGKTITLRGWRLWLFMILAYFLAAFVTVVLIFLFLGFAISLAMILLFAVPVALGFALLNTLFRTFRRD